MIQLGWISIHRKIIDSWLWKLKPYDKAHAFIDLLLVANHKENKIFVNAREVVIKRGETMTSEYVLSSRWGWGRTTVRSFLKKLKLYGTIDINPCGRQYTIIKIINYDKYQSLTTDNTTQNIDTAHVSIEGCTISQLDGNQQLDLNNNINKINNINIIDNNILTKDEEEFISILSTIEGYPLDRKKDREMFQKLNIKYPTLNILEATKDWAFYKMDKPLKKDDNARSQLNTACGNYLKWNKHTKGDELDENRYSFNATNKARTASNSKNRLSDIII